MQSNRRALQSLRCGLELLEHRHLLSAIPVTADLPRPQAIVARWPLTESSGVRHDIVGSNDLQDNVVSATDGYAKVTAGVAFGRAADFERDDQSFLSIPDTSGTELDSSGAFTIAAWFKPESLVTGALVSKYLPADNNVEMRLRVRGDQSIGFGISSTGAAVDFQEAISPFHIDSTAEWIHVVAVYSPQQFMAIYIDGIENVRKTTLVPGSVANTDAMFVVGGDEDGREGHLDGAMNDAIIWGQALSPEDIYELYQAYTAPDATAPETTINSTPPAISVSDIATFDFASSEQGSLFVCSLDAGAYEACAAPKTYSEIAEGSHTFSVRATDIAGNTDNTPASFTWNAITTHPLVERLIINGGDVQRSKISSVSVEFNTDVTVGDDAFSMQQIGGSVIGIDVITQLVDGRTIAHLMPREPLVDGNYAIVGRRSGVFHGPLAMENDFVDTFWKHFGDSNGDREVGFADLFALRQTFRRNSSDPLFNDAFDVDNDDQVSFSDLFAFRRTFRNTVGAKPFLYVDTIDGLLSPGQTYTVMGRDLKSDIQACIEVDLTLVQGESTTLLSTVTTEGDGDVDFGLTMPAFLPGGSIIQASHAGEILSSTNVTVLHPSDLIIDNFIDIFKRHPNSTNLTYWQSRTDVARESLSTAMELAQQEYVATQLKMELFTFNWNTLTLASETGVAEDEQMLARFTNGTAGEEASIHLVFQGTIVKSATETVNADGTVDVRISVPNPLLSEVFNGPVQGTLDVILVHGKRAQTQSLHLREGPRLLLKSAEVTEGEYMYFAIRGVAADEDVNVTVRYDWGSGSREQTWKLGRTDGSNRLGESNSKLLAPDWLRGEAQLDGIEIDIDVGDDHRGYRATLLKGASRDDIIAELIRTSGTSSIEAELAVLLSDEERLLADRLLGDDWEGNAAAIQDELNEIIVEGGGAFVSDTFIESASELAISAVLSSLNLHVSQVQTYVQLVAAFGRAYGMFHQTELEKNELESLVHVAKKWSSLPSLGSEYESTKDGVVYHHIGWDYRAVPGTPILSSVSGWVVDYGNSRTNTYGTMFVTIRVDLDEQVVLPQRKDGHETTDVVYVTLGHLRPSMEQKDEFVHPIQRFQAGASELTYCLEKVETSCLNGKTARIEEGQLLGYVEGYGPNEVPPPPTEFGLFFWGSGSTPHVHVTMTSDPNPGKRLAGVAIDSDINDYIHPRDALPKIMDNMT
ncbi:MAG: LamG domain-containing protein [Planctomycetales bacterium]|nr:LamG domain-containing protein [Planctomycetales bacterium]